MKIKELPIISYFVKKYEQRQMKKRLKKFVIYADNDP